MRPDTLYKEKSVEELKVGDSRERKDKLTRRHWRQGREKPITGDIICRAFNQDMGNRKTNRQRLLEPSNDEYDQYGDGTRKLLSGDKSGNKKTLIMHQQLFINIKFCTSNPLCAHREKKGNRAWAPNPVSGLWGECMRHSPGDELKTLKSCLSCGLPQLYEALG